MLEKFSNKSFEYRKLTEEEQQKRGILGRLIGPCADFVNSTRNGRKYPEQLWENVFNNPIMAEKIKNRCAFGELGHPENRTEVDMEKVALCLAEMPKKGNDGKLYAVFDILSTPNGKILKALCDYGCNIGISSRGQGDIISDKFGEDSVDPDTYDCECFDAVLVPGVEAARLKYVTESLHSETTLKKALRECLNEADDEGQKIMKDTLKELDLDISEDPEDIYTENNDVEDSAEEPSDETINIENDGDQAPEDSDLELELVDLADDEPEEFNEDDFIDYLMKNFTEEQVEKAVEILKLELPENSDDDSEPEESEENMEAADDEESSDDIENAEEIDSDEDSDVDEAVDNRSKALLTGLQEALKEKSKLETEVRTLQEKLAVSDAKVVQINEECDKCKSSIARLSVLARTYKGNSAKVDELNESLKKSEAIIGAQGKKIAKLTEALRSTDNKHKVLSEGMASKTSEITSLNEQLKDQETKFNEKVQTLTEQVKKATKIKENYRELAASAVGKYIEVKAEMYGIDVKEIKRKLGESYTLSDVDQVCEDLKSYQLSVSKLPFDLNRNQRVSVKVNENLTRRMPNSSRAATDDDVDSILMRLANLDD